MKRTLFTIGFLALAANAFGTPITIVSASGTGSGQAVGDWIGETWTQTGTYTGVTITANLNGGVSLASNANVYLMNKLGPGTTAGQNQVAFVAATIPAGTSGITLFTGLTLGPGTYYLLADESTAGWSGTVSPTYTTDSGITGISSFSKSGAIAGYSPDTSFVLGSGAYIFNVTGTPGSATPEPATMSLFSVSLAGLAWIVRRRRPS